MVCQAEVWRPNGVNLATVRSNQARTRVVPVNSKAANPPPPPRAYSGHLTGVLLRTVGNVTQNEAHPLGQLTFASGMLCTPRLCVYGSLLLHSLFLVAFFLEHLRTWRGAHEHQHHDLGENPPRPLLLLFGFHLFLFLPVLDFAPLFTTCIEPWND